MFLPEPPIDRTVQELELIRRAVAQAGELGTGVIHMCLSDPSLRANRQKADELHWFERGVP